MAKKKVEETKQEQHVSLAGYVPNLQKKYKEEIVGKLVGKLQKEFGFATVMQVPRLVKITLNQGIGDATGDNVGKLQKEFGFATVMQVPRLVKITLNQGIGDATGDKKLVEVAQQELTAIAGQKAVTTYSRKDISNFKLRRGTAIGVKVTLRGARMYEFLERLIAVSLPRIRDFNGINEKFDGRGNYTLGIKEQIIFPEIDIDKITKIFGLEITFVTSTEKDEEAHALLREFGLPFKNKKS